MIETSVVVVNYNGKKYVDKCIASILDSNTKDYEIIVVDNGSDDGSVEFLKDKYSKYLETLKFVELDKNYGPAYARNRGVEKAKGGFIGFLDNDTEVHNDWAVVCVEEFKKDKKLGVIQCKLLLASEREKIDYVGEYLGQNGFLVQRAPAAVIDKGQYDQKVEILAAKSAGMFIRKKTFEEIGGFDEDYFIYVEETDLGWRSWLLDYKAIFVSGSVVYHEFGTSSVILSSSKNNYNAKFHGSKNYILTLFKNLGFWNLVIILPVHIFLWVGLSGYSILRGQFKSGIWIWKGIFWNIYRFPYNLIKRRKIQKERVVSDVVLFKMLMKKKPFSYYLGKATRKVKLGNVEGFIKDKR